MAITLNGTTGITTPDVDSTADISVNGLTVGRGAGSVATNTVVGASALDANTTGASNVALGVDALGANTTANNNTAVGYQAGYSNTSGGGQHTFVGYQAGYSTNAGTNLGVGAQALYSNTTGDDNTAIGSYRPLYSNTTGSSNVAVGRQALNSNTTASNNTAVGYQAGYSGVTAPRNTCIGWKAGYANTTGYNCFVGTNSGVASTGYGNTFVGADYASGCGYLVTSGSNNTILGGYNGNQGGLDIRTANNYIVLSDGDGNPRAYWDSSGNFSSPPMYNHTTGSGANAFIRSDGYLQRSTSSLRYKNTVNDATHGLNELLTLRPVTYKSNNDGDTVYGGLIAEEVHDAGLTEFVHYADDGSPDALAYGNMVSLCVKAIQELKAELDTVKAELATLKGN